ncbi:autotransporter outer membrane beta-barrel domain-containing protein [Citrobacter sp. RHBSTW-00671]|uniref:autotransporter outer membrane beta-barrel domain-containing protein n=1 Tax=Citrobacter sp. RHBSTW-00671 TaxID=2742660 RepID=UPI0017CD4105|nr:autotransporter outer membrane beta-barrel domain-containing protein [Citrobacter sp. RHBSTW-00671]HCJ6376234.1 autotransporter outer membrane beta-barrel domain-containing protein [Citrobacter freundii]
MNRTYNIVWNAACNIWTVASEFARGDSRIKAQARAAGAVSQAGSCFALIMKPVPDPSSSGTFAALHLLNTHSFHRTACATAVMLLTLCAVPAQATTIIYINAGSEYSGWVANSGDVLRDFGSLINTKVNQGGEINIYNGGSATDTTVNQGGKIIIQSGGTATDVMLASGAKIVTGTGAEVTGTHEKGGSFSITGGTASNVWLDKGSELDVYNGNLATDTTVNGGILSLESEQATLEGTTRIYTGGALISNTGVVTSNGELLFDVDANVSRTEDMVFDGTGSLTKTGAGELVLSGVSTYSGDTLVNDGTLLLTDTGVIGNSGSTQDVNVAAGASFGGTGVVNGDVNNTGNVTVSRGNETGNTLTINGNYTGNNGNLYLNTQLDDDSSATDRLVITGDTSGSTTLYVTNVGGVGTQTANGIELIDVGGQSDGDFALYKGHVDINAWTYTLSEKNGDWYLNSEAQTTPPDDGGNVTPPDDGGNVTPDTPTDDGGNVTPATPQYRADIGAYLGNQWMARNLQMQTLYDREGSQYRSDDGSVWMRFKAGSAESQAAGGNVDIDNNYSQFQLGGDVLAWNNGEQSFTAGLMGSYINADTDSTGNRGADGSRFSASGNVDGYNIGLYATWFADEQNHRGLYVDSWYQYGTYNNNVDNDGLSSVHYDSTASAASLETGYRYDIALSNGNTVSLTPQAQLTWQRYDADSVTDDGGTRISGQDGDSWTSRLGLRVDGKLHKSGNAVIQPFMEANWLYTSDTASATFGDTEVTQDLPSSRAELKVGIQANLNSRWSVTGQVAGQKGSNDYGDLNGSLNLRYSW